MAVNIQLTIKHVLDRVVAGFLLIALAPVFFLIALMIKLEDGGRVFFRQRRPGLAGEAFEVWKFRTMVEDADRFLDKRGRATQERGTRIGRTLRRFSLDELPQLINIAWGEMSFVGPRPALMEHLPRYTDEQLERFRMKPGVTGLAQIHGRNSLPWSQRIRYDNEYIDNYSLTLDLKIAARTVPMVLGRRDISLDRNPDDVDDLGPPRDQS